MAKLTVFIILTVAALVHADTRRYTPDSLMRSVLPVSTIFNSNNILKPKTLFQNQRHNDEISLVSLAPLLGVARLNFKPMLNTLVKPLLTTLVTPMLGGLLGPLLVTLLVYLLSTIVGYVFNIISPTEVVDI